MNRTVGVVSLLLIAVVCAATALAQSQSGNVFGTVVDVQKQSVPGATVTLSGIGAPQVFVTDAEGHFRFVSLSPGRYNLKVELSGFGTVQRPVDVSVGANSDVSVTISPAVQEAITITAETPLLDVRRVETGQTVTNVELEQIPSARDPWVVLQTIPGVLVDRLNIGGNESGQQSYFTGKGVYRSETAWKIDGVNLTDMSALGASVWYYDFDTFQEVQVTTGTSDPRVSSSGVQLNMVTKRGTNELKGSGRWFWTDEEFQSDPTVPSEARNYLTPANRTSNIEEYGAEAGGPVWRDRMWLWGAASKQQIDILLASYLGTAGLQAGIPDRTTLENADLKLNAQIVGNNSAVASWSYSNKIKLGRGAGPQRPPETAYNQDGPGNIYKIEDTHIFSPNFYLTGLYVTMDNFYRLIPAGGVDAHMWRDEQRVYHGSYWPYEADIPQEQYRADGSAFLDTGNFNHELKFGFGYRENPVESYSATPGNMNWGRFFSDGTAFAYLTRPARPIYGSNYTDIYVGDTMLWGNLTIVAGLRWDLQKAQNDPTCVEANPVFPELLPGACFDGDDRALEWTTIKPRVGLTYALGDTRRTLLRASYNQYADQLGTGDVASSNPFYAVQGLYYYWEDRNGDKIVQRSEVLFEDGLYGWYNLDPDNPGAATPAGRVDYDMDVPHTDEIMLGVEHELVPAFTVGLNYTHRKRDDFTWTIFEKHQGAGDFYSKDDYVLVGNLSGALPDGTAYSVPYYRLKPGTAAPVFFVTTNRPDYHQTYDGFELVATKRMSNRWMLRGNVSWNDWKQHVGPNGFIDPTRLTAGSGCNKCDDETVADSGGKGTIFVSSRWSYNVSGIYELPWKLTLAANLQGREGYPVIYHHRVNPGDRAGNKNVLIRGINDDRLDDIFNVDLRLAKQFEFPHSVGLTVAADLFNATDERTVLQRDDETFTSRTSRNAASGRVLELQSPRIWRFSARVTF